MQKFRGRLKVGVDLGTANTVLAVVDRNNRPVAGASAPSHAIRDGVIVNYYESVQLVTKLKQELEENLAQNSFTELLPSHPEFPKEASRVSAMFWKEQDWKLQKSSMNQLLRLLC